jgi:hypothetical protein
MPEPSSATGAVFISYASQDAEAAARIFEALRTAGVEVWFDKSELRGGDAWDAQIKKQIHHCALFIPVISARTNARTEGYFRREWKLAKQRLMDLAEDAHFLVPVVIDDTREDHARVPEEFLDSHWTRLPNGETPQEFTRLVRDLLSGRDVTEHATRSFQAAKTERSPLGAPSLRPSGRSRAWTFGAPLAALLAAAGGLLWHYQRGGSTPAAESGLAPGSPAANAAPSARPKLRVFFQMSKSMEYERVIRDGFHKGLDALLDSRYEIVFDEGAGTRGSYWSHKDEWRDIVDEIVVRHPATQYIVTVGSDATSAMIDYAISDRMAATEGSEYKGMLLLGVTDPMRAGFARLDSATGIPGRAAVRYGSGANDWAGTILRALDESRLSHKPEFIYSTDQPQDSWVAAELAGSKLNGDRIQITGPIPGKLALEHLESAKIYFAWYALDELVDTYSSKMLNYRIVPSTYSEANARNFGLVVSPLDAEIGERGAQYLAKSILDGTPLESLPTQGPPFHTWINCSAIEKKGIPLSSELEPSEVTFVPDAGQTIARTDCLPRAAD